MGRRELPGSDIHIRNPGQTVVQDRAGQVVVGGRCEQARLNHRARCHHPHDLTRHQAIHRLTADLIADSHVVAALDQPSQVVFNRMVRDPGHRDPISLCNIARGQDNIELPCCDFSIPIKSFVKISQPEEQDRVRVLAFNREILLADGGQFRVFGHMRFPDNPSKNSHKRTKRGGLHSIHNSKLQMGIRQGPGFFEAQNLFREAILWKSLVLEPETIIIKPTILSKKEEGQWPA